MKKIGGMVKFNNKKGFTLAEVLVVLGLMAILLSLSIVGVASYWKDLKLMEMDSTARQIFIAAQNHLTEMEASGALKAYGKIPAEASYSPGTDMTQEPSDFDDSETWPSGGSDENHKFYYVVYNHDGEGGGVALENTILKGMLPFGSIDEEIRTDGSYIIEYDLKTANVYGVFYTDNENITLDYAQDVTLCIDKFHGRADTAEGKSTRKNQVQGDNNFILGYYGGAMTKSLAAVGLTVPNLNIVNEDTLTVEITDPNYFKEITSDGGGSTQVRSDIVLTVRGMESEAEKKFVLKLDDNWTNPGRADDVVASEKDLWTVESVGGGDDKALKYTFTLDDITKANMHFTDILRGFIPGENITLTVKCSSSHVLSNVVEKSAMTNSLFDSAVLDPSDSTKQTKNVSVKYIRHLENLNPKVSGLPNNPVVNLAGGVVKTVGIVKNVTQIADIDWGTSNWKDKAIYGYTAEGGTAKVLASKSFYGIENSNLKSYDGNGYELKNFEIKNETGSAGLFSAVNSVDFTVEKLQLTDFSVKGKNYAGALIGRVNGSNTNLLINRVAVVRGTETGLESTVTAETESAGGLIGGIASTGTIEVKNSLVAGVKVKSSSTDGAAGGLIGQLSGTDTASARKITNSYSGGMTTEGKYSTDTDLYNVRAKGDTGAASGGLVGRISGRGVAVNNCYSTCSVYGGNAGGLVGVDNMSGSIYKDCYAVGLVGTTGSGKAGAFGSKVSGTIDYCYYLKGINGDLTGLSGSDGSDMGLSKEDLSDLAIGSENQTKAYDSALTDSYPYKMVNNTGLEVGSTVLGHFGDWQEPVEETQEVKASYTFAYRETVEGEAGWYVVGKQKLKDGSVIDAVINTLKNDSNVTVDQNSTSYGFLVSEGDEVKNSQFHGAPENYINKDKAIKSIVIGGNLYDYYPIDASNKTLTQDPQGICSIPKWKNVGNDELSLYFNPDFAAAISTVKDGLGTDQVPYQIRTDAQKEKRNDKTAYNGTIFIYTANISE